MVLEVPTRLSRLQEKIAYLRHQGAFILQSGDRGFSSAPSNIAILKYWGKVENQIQIPDNPSLSFTLGDLRSKTSVTVLGRFSEVHLTKDQNLNDQNIEVSELSSVTWEHGFFLKGERVKVPAKMKDWLDAILAPWSKGEIALRIQSENNFPTACGIASSASGYAALAGAIADLLNLSKLFMREELDLWLSEWARLGSGSAVRSAYLKEASFVLWRTPQNKKQYEDNEPLLSFPAVSPEFQDLQHCVFIVSEEEKKTLSSEGHKSASSSPLYALRRALSFSICREMEIALERGDWRQLARLTEQDAFSMHAVMQTGVPPALYLDRSVAALIADFLFLREEQNLRAFWTQDAGPNPHFLFHKDDEVLFRDVISQLKKKHAPSAQLLFSRCTTPLQLGRATHDS